MIVGNGIVTEVSATLDTNDTSSVTDALDISAHKVGAVCFFVFANTGAHTAHVVALQYSPDGTNWETSGSNTITRTGHKVVSDLLGCKYIRLKVTTAEGGASTSDVVLQCR